MGFEVETLRQIALFKDLTADELQLISNIVIERSYRKKSSIFFEGEEKEAVYFIQAGLIKTYKTDENGHEHIVSLLKAGDMFPHTGLFNDSPYPATAEAILDTQLLAIPVLSFENLITGSPSIAMKVMRVMSAKIEELQQKLQSLTGSDVYNRGLAFLINLADKHGIKRDGVIHIDVPMTNQDFASSIGTTRETVNRLINQLRKQGILENHRNGYTILDYDALKSWSP